MKMLWKRLLAAAAGAVCMCTAVILPQGILKAPLHAAAYDDTVRWDANHTYQYTRDKYRGEYRYTIVGCDPSYTGVVVLPKNVKIIEKEAFRNAKLSGLAVDSYSAEGAIVVGERAFYNCTNLKSVTKATEYCARLHARAEAFYGCCNLQTVEPEVDTVERYTFGNCEKLLSLKYYGQARSLCEGAFYGCSVLTGIRLNPNKYLSRIEARAFQGTGLTSVCIPENVTWIGTNAFRNCRKLTDVTIPDSVTDIRMQAFKNCTRLKTVTIPASVKYIGAEAFNCVKTIKGYRGTAAETYAKKNGIRFVALG